MFWLLWLVLTRALLGLGGTDPGRPATPKQVEVWLGGPVDKMKGFAYPGGQGGRRPPFSGENGPHEVTVHLPSGRKATFWSKFLLVCQRDGTVTEVRISPVHGFAESRAAAEVLEREARKVHFHDPRHLFERLEEWRKMEEPPRTRPAGTGVVEERVTLFVQGEREEDKGDKGWWGTMSFSYWEDQTQWERLWPEYKKP